MAKDAMNSKSFYSHHGAWGGYFSFILGRLGRGGGFVFNDVKPPVSNIYAGYKSGNDKPRLLPFFCRKILGPGEEKYLFKNSNVTVDWCRKNAAVFKESKISRKMNWATETWNAEKLAMTIITPFDKIPDPAKMSREESRLFFCPAIFIQLEFDNTGSSDEMTGIFALQGMRRLISDASGGRGMLGVANGVSCGFAAMPGDGIEENLASNIVSGSFDPNKKINRLTNEGGLTFRVPAGAKKKFTIALAVYAGGEVTTGIKTKFYYTQFFTDLEDVLRHALQNFNRYQKIAADRDRELDSSGMNEYKKFMMAHFTRSYIANTELLADEKKKPLFIVNEGEYQMMNTLDLVVDQVFWEMNFTPWTVKNELESFLLHHSYKDTVKYTNGKTVNGDICFCHDQGVANMFSPDGYSSYELNGLEIFFSYMTFEEILNWLLTASIYGLRGNNSGWLKDHLDIFVKLFNTMVARDENNDGILDKDSSRCGDGAEITTYDSLDLSLGQARNNLYLAVKTWAAYICLEKIFEKFKNPKLLKGASERSRMCASTIISKYDSELKYIPAVFEKNNKSKIIPAIEGLIYPYIIGDTDAVSIDGRFGELVRLLKAHLENVLVPGSCINSRTGGWKLSSTSKNTWMSKIIINQFVAEKILHFKSGDWEKWDKIHSSWQQKGCSMFAATDQIDSFTGKDLGSRLYPRLVTALLWMKY